MKKNFVRVSILVLGAAAAVFAQVSHAAEADVPFDFTVAGTTMPAGHYVVDTTGATSIALYAVQSRTSRIVQTVGARTLDVQQNARLVFHRYGDQYFLHQVWITGLDSGRELLQTKHERSLSKGPVNSKRVIIAAN